MQVKSTKISTLYISIFAGMLEACVAFLRMLPYFFKTSIENLQNWNLSQSLLFLMAKITTLFSMLNYWFKKRMVDVSCRRISYTEFLNFLVFNCARDEFVQNVCVFFIFRYDLIPLTYEISENFHFQWFFLVRWWRFRSAPELFVVSNIFFSRLKKITPSVFLQKRQ